MLQFVDRTDLSALVLAIISVMLWRNNAKDSIVYTSIAKPLYRFVIASESWQSLL